MKEGIIAALICDGLYLMIVGIHYPFDEVTAGTLLFLTGVNILIWRKK
jgi:hypothetical protein